MSAPFSRNPGLCIISTREEVKDLEGAIERVDLEKVSTVAGRALLRIGGLPGNDAELEGLVEDFGNHALALNLLAAFLKWPGAGGAADIPELADIPEEKGRHARRVMAAFSRIFGEGPALDLLRILGLFDGPIEETVINALLADPPIEGLTEHLSLGRSGVFDDAKATLRRAKMLATEGTHQPPRLDSHPLVREHFGEELENQRPEAWRAGHARLFEHYKGTAEPQPSTLEGLAPLYAAVAHGCAAGHYNDAFENVYYQRILREQQSYSLHKLGAFGSDLAAVSSFFEKPWTKVAGELSEGIKAFLLNAAGFRLRALGRLREAVEPMDAGMQPDIDRGDLQGAARSALNLSELQLTLGEVQSALDYAERSDEYANRSGDEFLRLTTLTTQANAEHHASRLGAGEKLFREAKTVQEDRQPSYPLLYSLGGYLYCDLLLAQGHPAKAQDQAQQTLEWAKRGGQGSLLDIALDHLTLGRAALALGELTEAASQLNRAVDGLRPAGQQEFVARGLLDRAEFHRTQGDLERARHDLHEVHKIARRDDMRLHLTDYHLESARLALAESDPAAARDHLAKARKLVDETGYHRRDPDLAEIESQLPQTHP